MWKLHREIWNDRLHRRLMNSCDLFLIVIILSGPMIWFPIYIWMWKIHCEIWNDRLHWRLMNSCDFFFNCDDFVWTNDLWFPIYIWMWKLHREVWNDRLHWRLMNSCDLFLIVIILSGPMIWFLLYIWIWRIRWLTSSTFLWTIVDFSNVMILSGPMIWFPIYIWMWKIHREMWNDRLHWRLMNSCDFF